MIFYIPCKISGAISHTNLCLISKQQKTKLNLSKTRAFADDKIRFSYPEDRIFNRVISDISIVLRESTLTISDSTETGTPLHYGSFPFTTAVGSERRQS